MPLSYHRTSLPLHLSETEVLLPGRLIPLGVRFEIGGEVLLKSRLDERSVVVFKVQGPLQLEEGLDVLDVADLLFPFLTVRHHLH